MKTINVGLLGLAHLHPPSFMPHFAALPGVQVVAAAEADERLRESFSRSYAVRTYADWRELLKSQELDLAVLWLPHAECPEAAEECARRGIHLLVEKPMAADTAGIRRIIAAAGQAGVIAATPYVWRHHPVSRQMKALLAEGALGRVVTAHGRCAAGRPDRYRQAGAHWMLSRKQSGGGPMHNLGVHWIDLYRWLLEDEVVAVVGNTVHLGGDYDVEDACQAVLTFSRGAAVTLEISYLVPPGFPSGRHLELALYGTAGVLTWNPSYEGLQERLSLCSDAPGFAEPRNREVQVQLADVPGYFGAAGREYLEQLMHALRTGGQPPVGAHEGLRNLQVVEAIYHSAATGRTVRVAA